jgi:Sulfotransferase domain
MSRRTPRSVIARVPSNAKALRRRTAKRYRAASRVYRRAAWHFRSATSGARILPSFLIIGAQRAGTTSLFSYLERHPDVAVPASGRESVRWNKELQFFNDRYSRGLTWYRSFFPTSAARRLARSRGHDLLAGEASPSYLFDPVVPGRVAESIPDVRLIVLLRDPIERAYSHYQHMRRLRVESRSFEEAVALEETRLSRTEKRPGDPPVKRRRRRRHRRHFAYLTRGVYADQLERWFEHFPREQLLVLRTDDLLAKPADVYAETLAFLGLRPWDLKEFVPQNRASYAPIDPDLRSKLESYFAEPNARLAKLLGMDLGWGSPAPEPSDGVEVADRGPRAA